MSERRGRIHEKHDLSKTRRCELLDVPRSSAYYRRESVSVRIPVQPDHRIRRKPITDSDSTRSLIPDEPDHRFRCQADHFFAAAGIVQGVWCEGARGAG